MIEICTAIPDATAVLALEPEELGLQLLAFAADRQGMIHPISEGNNATQAHFNAKAYATHDVQIKQALSEAWAWLEGQVLVIPAEGQNGQNGYRIVSRRGRRVVDGGIKEFRATQMLPKELIHSSIRQKTWMDFVRGEYDVAVFHAMKEVEVAIRWASGLPDSLVGVKLARTAFHPDTGALTDMSMEAGEKHARAELFAGAIGAFKNPQSHRRVNLSDPVEAIEQIMIASHLLRIVDGRKP